MRAAIYARVSSDKQQERHTIASQLRELPEVARARGWAVVGTYVDDGLTAKAGHLDKREGLARLLADASARLFDVVLVVDTNRLTRSEDLIERAHVYGTLQRAGVLLSVGGGEPKPADDLVAQIKAAFDALENSKRSEAIRRGIREAARQGRAPSRPPWGLAFDFDTRQWSIDDATAPLVREMYERVAAGESTETIAADMEARGVPRPRVKRWDRERVYALVTSSAYRGEWVVQRDRPRKPGEKSITIAVPALVDADLWHAAQEALSRGKMRGLRRTRHVYLLEGLADCGLCGAPLHIHHGRAHYSYYQCARRRKPRRWGGSCSLPLLGVADIDGRTWDVVSSFVARPDLLSRSFAERGDDAAVDEGWAADLDAWQARLARLEDVELAVLEQHRRGVISRRGFEVEGERIRREREMVERQLATARERVAAAASAAVALAGLEAMLADLRPRLSRLDAAGRRDVLRAWLPGTGSHRATVGADRKVRIPLLLGAAVGLAMHSAYQKRDGANAAPRLLLLVA